MIIISSRVSNNRTKKGFTIVELLISVSVMGILTAVGVHSMFGFYEQRSLRNAALEAMDMIREQRAKVMAERPTGTAACITLNPNNINQRLVSRVTGLEVITEAGGNPADLCFTPEGLASSLPANLLVPHRTRLTFILRSPAVSSQGDWCVVVTPLLAQTHLGWRQNGPNPNCSFAGAGGSL
jgi:prepilin-type N-terminal cleavage/methylation domain-containing protein